MKFSVHSYALKLFFDVSRKTRLKFPRAPAPYRGPALPTSLTLVVSSCAFAGNILITSLLGCHHRVISLLRGFVLPAMSAFPELNETAHQTGLHLRRHTGAIPAPYVSPSASFLSSSSCIFFIFFSFTSFFLSSAQMDPRFLLVSARMLAINDESPSALESAADPWLNAFKVRALPTA